MLKMKLSKLSNDSQNAGGRLRNFDLSVEEIRTIKAIKDMTQSLDSIEDKNTQPERVEYFRNEIIRLEEQLEDIRDNTLIR
jgi:hypothetical protein